MDLSKGPYQRFITADEQLIYNHLLWWIERESPEQMLCRFKSLFIDGYHYPDAEISKALDKITALPNASDEFRFIVNRCCHILINRWQLRSHNSAAITQLIDLFQAVPDAPVAGMWRHHYVRRLRELMRQFLQTEQYYTLRRLAELIRSTGSTNSRLLGTLIGRYPYLYGHCLISEDSSREHRRTVRHIQTSAQSNFEIALSKYLTVQVRAPQRQAQTGTNSRSRQPLNPTLLSDRALNQAIKHYGPVVPGQGYRHLAQTFMARSGYAQSYGAFKKDLYHYLTDGIDPGYGKRQFNAQLCRQLEATLPESDFALVDDFLVVRTCSYLFNFLVVDGPKNPQHFVFVDLFNNIGPVLTMGLLLKLVLLCRRVRPYLERRFSILFNHYETHRRDTVSWLVHALELLNVALTTNFGKIDTSLLVLAQSA
ncbi:MAG: hypothetical protein AAF289_02535 [Cyanobacteria bacterium P01_A01_bin.135]